MSYTLNMLNEIEEYPTTIMLTEDDLPAIKKWKVDGKYKIELSIKQISSNRSIYGDKKLTATFAVTKVKDLSDPMSRSSEDHRKEVAKAMEY